MNTRKLPAPETAITHRPAWRGCGSLVQLPEWPTGGVCGEPGVMCIDCYGRARVEHPELFATAEKWPRPC